MNKIVQGDCLEVMRGMEKESVDLIVTDPPYGYSFMEKNWDRAVPSVDIWKECLRVLKPGAFAFVMSAPRQDVLSQMIVRLGQAGFDTSFTSLYWTYGSGFPKAMNISKAIDRRAGADRKVVGTKLGQPGYSLAESKGRASEAYGDGLGATGDPEAECAITAPATPQAIALDGSYGGFQPKPAVEVILVCMKPLSEKTYVDQALKNGKGVTWLDDARIPTAEPVQKAAGEVGFGPGREDGYEKGTGRVYGNQGRFPANLLVSDDVLNDGKVRKSGNLSPGHKRGTGINFGGGGLIQKEYGGDSGSYSRFFSLDAWAKTIPFLIVPKAAKSEKSRGLPDGMKASHPTTKPLTLMSYLVTLGSREGDIVLDPFLGSGTTACAAKQLKRGYIGIEREEEYVKIAAARVSAFK